MATSSAAGSLSAVRIDQAIELPKSFQVTSGELLWGQYHCLLQGSRTKSHDGSSSSKLGDGEFRYRVAARKGEWDVSRLFIDDDTVGFIAYHRDTDPVEYARLASDAGIAMGGPKPDKERIVYVNRYDWSAHHNWELGKEFLQHGTASTKCGNRKASEKDEDEDDDDDQSCQVSSCCVLLDAAYFTPLVKCYGDAYAAAGSKEEHTNKFPPKRCFSYYTVGTDSSSKKTTIGIHLTNAATEYELAWIGFSGKPHPDFPNSDECVAFVYDTSYSGLELEKGQKLKVDDAVVKEGNQ